MKLRECPFCGGEAEVCKEPAWQGSHGYIDCYFLYVKCINENCAIKPSTRKYDTIYETDEEKQKCKAAQAWNRRVKDEVCK